MVMKGTYERKGFWISGFWLNFVMFKSIPNSQKKNYFEMLLIEDEP